MSRPALLSSLLKAAVLAGLLAAGLPAAAATAAPSAFLRGAHLSPDTPGVDVYLTAFSGGTSRLWLSSVGYGDVSAYAPFAAGLYAVSMRPHGAAAATPPALTWTLDAQPGAAYTAAAVGLHAQLHGIVLRDQLTPPAAGTARVRVIQAASQPPTVDVLARNGPVIARDVAFTTTTPYVAVPGGDWTILAQGHGSPPVTGSTAVSWSAGTVNSLVVLNTSSGGLTVKSLLDAGGSSAMPVGAVPAGAGGTARAAGSGDRTSEFLLAAGLVAFAVGAGGVRRGLRSRRREGACR